MITVIGAGVVGLAAARAIAQSGREVCVLERAARIGQGASTRNSGVIHAGLYYPADTLKASLCVDGRDQLYAYCEARGVPHARCGKLIVATSTDDEPAVDALARHAARAGVLLEPQSAAEIARREPHVNATRGLWSPLTGWLEVESYLRALAEDLQRADVPIVVGAPLTGAEWNGTRWTVRTPLEEIPCDWIVNAAGLYADDVSRMCGGEDFTIYPCRGEYAELAPRARGMVNGLVYPVPHHSGHGLGVHLTRTLDGAVWIGPTIRYQDRKDDYEDGRLPLDAFLEPTRQLLPRVSLDDLRLAGSGIRAKLHPPSERFADFRIGRDRVQPGLVQAAGIDSPGLTASLAIADEIVRALD